MSEIRRKRNRDPLAKNEYEKLYEKESQKKKCFLEGSQSLKVRTPSQVHRAVEKALQAAYKSHGKFETPQKNYCESSSSSVVETTPDYFKARRVAIYYQFLNYGAPKESRWEEIKLVNNIMFNLEISPGNRSRVIKTLQDCLQSVNNKMDYKLPRDNPLKFQLGTPTHAFSCMMRCWQVEPTPARVLQDIESWEFTLDKIIEARGTVVSGLALRHGHRWAKANGKGESTNRMVRSQRKGTLSSRPVHADALPSLNRLIGIEDQVLLMQLVNNAEEEVQAEALKAGNEFVDDEPDSEGDVDD